VLLTTDSLKTNKMYMMLLMKINMLKLFKNDKKKISLLMMV